MSLFRGFGGQTFDMRGQLAPLGTAGDRKQPEPQMTYYLSTNVFRVVAQMS
jgi:hypothetical protein